MIDPTLVVKEGFQARTAAMEESLFALGNGYIGLRGNYEEGYAGPLGVEGCYINAFHETEKIRYGEIAHAYAEESQTMLNLTSSQRILLSVDGKALHPEESLSTVRTLHMMEGILTRETVYAVINGKLTVKVSRLVCQKRSHAAMIRMELTADTACTVTATPLLDGNVTNLIVTDDPRIGSGLKGRVLSVPVIGKDGIAVSLSQHTQHTHLAEACAMAVRMTPENPCEERTTEYTTERIYMLTLQPGKPVVIEKAVVYYDGADAQEDALRAEALREVKPILEAGWDNLYAEQKSYMEDFWAKAGIWVDGDPELLQGLRFNLYHLLQSAGRNGRSNTAAKGLTGEGYEGHYFWDTETYIFPFFLHVMPEIARSLLTYRYSILPFARERAREMSHPNGAMYPWRTINGRQASAYFPAGTAQIHIDADIAMAVKRYWEATDDMDFMANMGTEIVCETARFFLDWGFYSEHKGGAFVLNCVTGPDEYNVLVNNNAYTNLMAQDNMRFAVRMLDILKERCPEKYQTLITKIGLKDSEPAAWSEAAEKMYIPRDEAKHLVLQDDGFMDREPWPIESIPKENFPLLLHYHPLEIYRHQVCKQADTVLAGLLIPGVFTKEEEVNNFNFYDKCDTHDSSLSRAAYSAAAAHIGYLDQSYEDFLGTARMDLDDTHNNTRDGLHMANMAGTWFCIVSGFGGMKITQDGISFDPVLPAKMKGYSFCVAYMGRVISVRVTAESVSYCLVSGEPLEISDRGEKRVLA